MTDHTAADPRWGTTLTDEVLSELIEASSGKWVGAEFRITGSGLCALLQAVYEGGIAAARPPAA